MRCFPPDAAVILALAGSVLAGSGLSACGPRVHLPNDALDGAIGAAIGDPTTCVLLAKATSGRPIYRYGELFNCDRGLPACDRAGFLSAKQALAFAARGRTASCASSPDGSRQVGWAEGRYGGRHGAFLYSAAMEGQRALPGEEMKERLSDAFIRAGL